MYTSPPKNSHLRRRGAIAISAAAALSLTAGCSVFGGGDDADDDVIRIGVTAEQETNRLLAQLAEDELGYDVEIVNFDDYNQPNPALSNGDLDANWFQHIAYLANYNVANEDDLSMIGTSEIVPLPLYSETYDSVDEFQEGDEVAIANDEINQARGINVLVASGLVTLQNEVAEPRPSDIDEEASTVSVQPVDAAQTVNALQSVEGSIINNSFSSDAELDPNTALFSDDPNDDEAFPYVNGFVVRAEDRDNEALQEIAALYHDERVLESAAELSEDTSVPVEAELERIDSALKEYEDSLQDSSEAEGE